MRTFSKKLYTKKIFRASREKVFSKLFVSFSGASVGMLFFNLGSRISLRTFGILGAKFLMRPVLTIPFPDREFSFLAEIFFVVTTYLLLLLLLRIEDDY